MLRLNLISRPQDVGYRIQEFLRGLRVGIQQGQHLVDLRLSRLLAASTSDRFDCLSLTFIADVRVVFVRDFGVRPEDGQQHSLRHARLSAEACEAVPERMEAVHGHFLFPSRHINRGLQANPANHPQHVKVDEVVADIFPLGIRVVVSGRRFRRDILIGPPFFRLDQSSVQLRGHRDRHLFARLELLHP